MRWKRFSGMGDSSLETLSTLGKEVLVRFRF
jgi:hypothetical protein